MSKTTIQLPRTPLEPRPLDVEVQHVDYQARVILIMMNFNTPYFHLLTATPTEKEEKDMTGAIIGGVIGGVVFILLVILGVWYFTKQKKKKSGRISPEDALEPAPVD